MKLALTLSKAGAYAGLAVALLAYTAAVVRVHDWMRPAPKAPQAETVRVDRTITKRDTVTQTVVDEVVRYDTVEATDTLRVAVPTDMTVQGVIPPSPVDVGDQVTLTYYDTDAQRWTQNRYRLPTDTWGVGLRGDLTAGPWLHATGTLDIIRYAQVGPMGLEARFGAGYAALITDEYRAGPVVSAGIRIGYDW